MAMTHFAFQSKYLDSCNQPHLPCVNKYQHHKGCFGPEVTKASEKTKVFSRQW